MSEHLLTSHGYHIISIQNDYFKFDAVFTMAVLNSFQTHCDLQSKHKSHNDWKAFYSECFLQWKLFMIVNSAAARFNFLSDICLKTRLKWTQKQTHYIKRVPLLNKQCAFERRNTMVTVELLKLTIEIYCNRFSTSVKTCFWYWARNLIE